MTVRYFLYRRYSLAREIPKLRYYWPMYSLQDQIYKSQYVLSEWCLAYFDPSHSVIFSLIPRSFWSSWRAVSIVPNCEIWTAISGFMTRRLRVFGAYPSIHDHETALVFGNNIEQFLDFLSDESWDSRAIEEFRIFLDDHIEVCWYRFRIIPDFHAEHIFEDLFVGDLLDRNISVQTLERISCSIMGLFSILWVSFYWFLWFLFFRFWKRFLLFDISHNFIPLSSYPIFLFWCKYCPFILRIYCSQFLPLFMQCFTLRESLAQYSKTINQALQTLLYARYLMIEIWRYLYQYLPAVQQLRLHPSSSRVLDFMKQENYVTDGNIQGGFVNLFVTDEFYQKRTQSVVHSPKFEKKMKRSSSIIWGEYRKTTPYWSSLYSPLRLGNDQPPASHGLWCHATVYALRWLGWDIWEAHNRLEIFRWWGRFWKDPVHHLLEIYVAITEKRRKNPR